MERVISGINSLDTDYLTGLKKGGFDETIGAMLSLSIVWHDILCRQAVPGEWSYICATYDMVTGISKMYFNGLLVGSRENVPCLKVANSVILGGDEYQNSFKGRK